MPGIAAPDARITIPGGANSANRWAKEMAGLMVVEAHGSHFTDSLGRRFLDFHGGAGPCLLGHCRLEVDQAAAKASASRGLVGVACSDLEVTLAERIVSLVPSSERVLLTSTGSEATYHALRVARAVTGRPLILKFQGCYHGWHDSVAMNVMSPPGRLGSIDPLSRGSMDAVLRQTLVLEFNDASALAEVLTDRGDEIAAVIVEPIVHNVGALLPRPGFLEELRSLCSQKNVILIFDEVITGFRHDLGGYQAISGVTPDLTTLGKAMANGYPIGALTGRADLMDQFSTNPQGDVLFAGTYNGHPGAVAAALETIRILCEEPIHGHLFRLGDLVRQGFTEIASRAELPLNMCGFGSIFIPYFLAGDVHGYRDLLRNDASLFVGYRRRMLERGIFEFPGNLRRSHLSAAHTVEDVDRYLAEVETAIRAELAGRPIERGQSLG